MDPISKNINQVEIWGGAEYTIARINNSFCDQMALSGHEERLDDLNLFSELNIRTIRYPLLWEKYFENSEYFFRLHDERLNKLQKLNIKPIAGLLHHGSGPVFTDLCDRNFPGLLAEFAATIAYKYPWIDLYTPVNEPLTTARFSGLYGIWYPHKKDDYSFCRILLNELKGIVLSMHAIKLVNPGAKLIQTEDICKIHSTEQLKYQADFENHRRWLSYDLLLGRVDPEHPMWQYFINSGIKEQELYFFIENKIIPSVCGFNYYVTSERFLDHRLNLYPPAYQGGNQFQSYADVEAVRANIPMNISSEKLLKEAWQRYHLPIALTETHLACTREEQLRWFYEAYQTAISLKSEGIDFRAVTAWSFFGSYDLNSLLCTKNSHYEPGVFDLRSGKPRATALAGMIKSIIKNENYHKDLIAIPGWWKRGTRHIYRAENENIYIIKDNPETQTHISPLLIIGATGSLGTAFAKICEYRGIVYYLTNRSELDIASETSVKNILEDKKPWGVVNAAGFTRIDEAEKSILACFRENTIGPGILADMCKMMGIKFVTFSTDQVFNGKKNKPYLDTDHTQPLNLYGFSKSLAEENVLKVNPDTLVIRSGFFFNPWHLEDRLGRILQSGMISNGHHYLPSDIIISPAYMPDLVNTALDLLIDGESGIWHLSNQEEISHFEFARLALRIAGLKENHIFSVPSSKMEYTAIRPSYSVLNSSYGITLPILNNAIHRYISEFTKAREAV